MRQDDWKHDVSDEAQVGRVQQRGQRPAPGKVARTSKLPGSSKMAVQNQAVERVAATAAPKPRSLSDLSMDSWMDAAHRGLTAFSETDQPVPGNGEAKHSSLPPVGFLLPDMARQNNGQSAEAHRSSSRGSPVQKMERNDLVHGTVFVRLIGDKADLYDSNAHKIGDTGQLPSGAKIRVQTKAAPLLNVTLTDEQGNEGEDSLVYHWGFGDRVSDPRSGYISLSSIVPTDRRKLRGHNPHGFRAKSPRKMYPNKEGRKHIAEHRPPWQTEGRVDVYKVEPVPLKGFFNKLNKKDESQQHRSAMDYGSKNYLEQDDPEQDIVVAVATPVSTDKKKTGTEGTAHRGLALGVLRRGDKFYVSQKAERRKLEIYDTEQEANDADDAALRTAPDSLLYWVRGWFRVGGSNGSWLKGWLISKHLQRVQEDSADDDSIQGDSADSI